MIEKMPTWRIVWRFLAPVEKAKLFVVLLLMIITTLAEVVSVGLIVPALSVLSDATNTTSHPWIQRLPIGAEGEQLVIVLFTLMLIGFIIKNFVVLASSWYQNKFTLSVGDRLATDLFSNYLHAPYAFHLEQRSPELLRNVQRGDAVMHSGAKPLLSLAADTLLSIGLLSLLVVQQPLLVVFVLLALGVLGYVYLAIMKPFANRWGRLRHENATTLIKLTQEGVGGIQEVKIFGAASFLAKRFDSTRRHDSRIAQIAELVALLPRSFLESLSVGVLALFVVIQVQSGRNVADLIPTLGLFALVGFRLLPLAIGVVNRLQTLQTSRAIIESVASGLLLTHDDPSSVDFTKSLEGTIAFRVLQFSDVWFSYPGIDAPVLSGASAVIRQGDFVGIVGESGAGKSTFIDLSTGLSSPQRGDIWVNDIQLKDIHRQWLAMIGYVPQSVFLSDDSLAANVAFGHPEDEIDVDLVFSCLRLAGLTELVSDLPDGISERLGERGARLSGGQIQRVGIARALYRRPQVLILDEATSALDRETEKEILGVLKDLNKSITMILVTHRESALESCNRTLRIENGKVFEVPKGGNLGMGRL